MTMISRRLGLLACIWSGIYLVAAVAWKLGAPLYPYGRHWDPSPRPISVLDGVSAGTGQTILICGAALGLVSSLILLLVRRRDAPARIATVAAVSVCVGMVVAGDYRPLMAIARVPVFLVTHLVWGVGDISIATFVRAMYDIPAMHGFWQLLGIVVLLAAARQCWRRISDGCPDCGRPPLMSGWTTRHSARRWGLIAALVAAICPLPYAVTRYLLVLGIPADGISAAQIREFNAETPGIWIFGAGLATFGVLGSILTLGLVQRWGERWPFWVLGLRGRPINPWVAIIPAGFVSLLWPGSSLMFIRVNIQHYLERDSELWQVLLAPMNLWLFWGFALAAATLAYWLRRRPDCPSCRRGAEPMRGVWTPRSTRRTDSVPALR